MAKLQSVFLLAIIYSLYVQHANCDEHTVSREKLKEAAMVIVNDCKNQVGASDTDIEALTKHQMPATREGLCLLQCLFSTARIMQNNKLNREGAVEFFTPGLQGDDQKISKMVEMIILCDKEIGDVQDGCQVAKLIIECTIKHGKDFGFTFPNHLKSV